MHIVLEGYSCQKGDKCDRSGVNGGLNLSVTKVKYRESSIWPELSIDGLKSNASYAKEGFVCFVNFYRFIDRLKKEFIV